MMVSDTLCDLLSRRIGRLDAAMQQVLKIASLIGFSFPTSILFRVTSLERFGHATTTFRATTSRHTLTLCDPCCLERQRKDSLR
jgi:predicted ATPase